MKGFGMEGCPGSSMQDFRNKDKQAKEETGKRQSQLGQWPVQLW